MTPAGPKSRTVAHDQAPGPNMATAKAGDVSAGGARRARAESADRIVMKFGLRERVRAVALVRETGLVTLGELGG